MSSVNFAAEGVHLKGRNECGRAAKSRAGQGRAGQGRAGQGRAGQGRAGRHAHPSKTDAVLRAGLFSKAAHTQHSDEYCHSHDCQLMQHMSYLAMSRLMTSSSMAMRIRQNMSTTPGPSGSIPSRSVQRLGHLWGYSFCRQDMPLIGRQCSRQCPSLVDSVVGNAVCKKDLPITINTVRDATDWSASLMTTLVEDHLV